MAADDLIAIPRAAIQDLIGGLSGFACYWDGDAQNYDTTYIRLNVMAYRTIGVDEVREEYDSANDQIKTVLCGLRAFTLNIRVDSYSMNEPGYEILERIRRRLRGGAAKQILREEGLALTKMTNPITDLDELGDNRPIYAAMWDVGMTFAVNEVDTQPQGGGGYIKDAPATGTLTGTQHDPKTLNIDPNPQT